MEYRVDRYGDTTITIRQMHIKDIQEWDVMMEKGDSSAKTDFSNDINPRESDSSLI